MTNPLADALKLAISQPGMAEKIANMRSIGAHTLSHDEAIQAVQRWADVLHNSARWPINAVTTHHPDGTMTIHVTPHHPS